MPSSTCKLLCALFTALLLSACGAGSADISVIAAPSQAPLALAAAPASSLACGAGCGPAMVDGLAEQSRQAALQRGQDEATPVYPRVAAHAVELREPRLAPAFGSELQ